MTFLQLFVPFVFMLILFVLQQLYDDIQEKSKRKLLNLAPPVEKIEYLPKCLGEKCKTIIYSPTNHTSVDFIMKHISYYNKPELKHGLNISDHTLDVVGMTNETVLMDYILQNPNKTLMAVSFEMTRAPLFNVYTIFFNSSSKMTEKIDTTSPLIYSLDKAFCKFNIFNSSQFVWKGC